MGKKTKFGLLQKSCKQWGSQFGTWQLARTTLVTKDISNSRIIHHFKRSVIKMCCIKLNHVSCPASSVGHETLKLNHINNKLNCLIGFFDRVKMVLHYYWSGEFLLIYLMSLWIRMKQAEFSCYMTKKFANIESIRCFKYSCLRFKK